MSRLNFELKLYLKPRNMSGSSRGLVNCAFPRVMEEFCRANESQVITLTSYIYKGSENS